MADLDANRALTLEEAARRIGRYAWVEMRLFEVLGGWVPTVPELDVKLHLGTHADHHAWHAQLWHERLPSLPHLPVDELVRPGDGVDAFMDALGEPRGSDQTVEKLVGLYRVLVPHKVAAYTHHRERTTAVADAPTTRALDLALRDEVDGWLEGNRLLASLLLDEGDVRRAADHQARLESLLVSAGGICGPGTLDER